MDKLDEILDGLTPKEATDIVTKVERKHRKRISLMLPESFYDDLEFISKTTGVSPTTTLTRITKGFAKKIGGNND
ncbi:MAG: hypothetical protein Kapaf2KO_22650 [Candidatus Kapaibacteriales bacterium]